MAVSIFDSRDLRQHLSPTIDQPIANVDVPFWDTVKASLGYTYDPLMDFISNRLKYDYDDDYSPEFDLAGYEEYSSSLLYARSANHMIQLKSQIDDNIQRRKILENSSFWAQVGASILDPINIITIPLGGPAITLGRVAARSAIGVGALQTGLEAIRYPFDPLATVDEAALNIGFAAVTGGLIGGAINVPRAMRFKSLNKMIKTADENANEQINLNNINNMLNNNTLTIAQDPKARKKFNNKTQEELKKEGKVVDEDKGFFGGIKSMLTNDLVGPMSVDPQVLQQLTDRGVTDFTPYDKFSPFSLGVGALNAAVQQVPIGILGAVLSKLTGSEVVGTFTDPLTGQMMALDTLGKTTFISPDALSVNAPDESGFSATDVDAVVPVEEKKIEEKEDEKSPMSKLLAQRINNASKIDPNVKIIMDVYGISQEEAQEFLGKKGVGTGSASEFEGI